MEFLNLYRKRLIPDECIHLKDDKILLQNKEIILTSWQVLHPRKDFSHGFSCYYLKQGCKVSKFCRSDDSLLYWYCDIVDYQPGRQEGDLIIMDLLADVICEPEGQVKVVDLDELARAFSEGLLGPPLLEKSLLSLNRLLTEIYQNGIGHLARPIEEML